MCMRKCERSGVYKLRMVYRIEQLNGQTVQVWEIYISYEIEYKMKVRITVAMKRKDKIKRNSFV